MKREIIKIDDGKCDGCGLCIPECHEGALQIIDDKAVLLSDLMCDGLGACIGHCPQEALTIEEREAEPYDEIAVMKEMISKGRNVVLAHMKHLKDHEGNDYLKQGVKYLTDMKHLLEFDPADVIQEVHNHGNTKNQTAHHHMHSIDAATLHAPGGGGCPGSRPMSFEPAAGSVQTVEQSSALRQWPVQGHLVNPGAGYFQGSDLLVCADCVAYSLGNFHSKYLKNKSLFIACPKLDSNLEVYRQKLVSLIDKAQVNTVTVMIMEVPCCGGLLQLVQSAAGQSLRKVPVKTIQVGVQGEILEEQWV